MPKQPMASIELFRQGDEGHVGRRPRSHRGHVAKCPVPLGRASHSVRTQGVARASSADELRAPLSWKSLSGSCQLSRYTTTPGARESFTIRRANRPLLSLNSRTSCLLTAITPNNSLPWSRGTPAQSVSGLLLAHPMYVRGLNILNLDGAPLQRGAAGDAPAPGR